MSMLVWVVRPPLIQPETQLKEIVRWAQLARREGLLGLEDVVESVRDAMASAGLLTPVEVEG